MRFIVLAACLLPLLALSARERRDTLWTAQNDKIILTYQVASSNGLLSIDFSRPRILLAKSSSLSKQCKGETEKLKVVVFDRIGDFGKTKWSGISPMAFMVPSGMSYEDTPDGYYILGESQPLEFRLQGSRQPELKLPMYIAVYEKKQRYRLVVSCRQPLSIKPSPGASNSPAGTSQAAQHSPAETIAIHSTEELEAENDDITSALSSIDMVKELLSRETELPFSNTLQMEIFNLNSLKGKIREPEVIEKINAALLLCDDKERELKESQKQSALAAKAEEQALLEQQKQEADALQKEAEEKAKLQEEKQERRTIWMIAGGVILAIVGFVVNGIFKHFRDIRNQKNILEMQESLARQAEHEAGRRTREIVRNKAHQAANKGRTKLRQSMNGSTTHKPMNKKRRSI